MKADVVTDFFLFSLYADYLRYFDDEVNTKGLKKTLDLYFTQVMGESIGAALHPLINIGYALEFSNPILLSEGLAYTCTSPLEGTSKILENSDSVRTNADTTVFNLIEELQTLEIPELQNEEWNFPKKTEFVLETHWRVFRDLIAK